MAVQPGKKIDASIKLHVPAGQAKPGPPVGPALGQHGLNIMDFCKAFNAETQSLEAGMPIPVIITVYADKSFTYPYHWIRVWCQLESSESSTSIARDCIMSSSMCH